MPEGQNFTMAGLMEPWVIALVSAIASGSVTVVGAAYWFGRNSLTREDLQEVRELITAETRAISETFLALRQKITEVELDLAKNYVRRDSWHQAMNSFQESMSKNDAADQQWKLRIEEKLDRLAERISS